MNPTNPTQSIDERERVRRSMDKIRVNNPFDKIYTTVWDGFHHPVPARGFAIMDRYLAEKWLEEQCKRIMTQTADNAVKDENARRMTSGQSPMDRTRKTGEQLAFESPFYSNWNARFIDIIREYGLYGGIAEEFGMEYVPADVPQNNQTYTSLIEQLEATPPPLASPTPTPQPTVAPQPIETPVVRAAEPSLVDALESKGVFALRKLAKEKGIAFENTTKKDELIRMITQ